MIQAFAPGACRSGLTALVLEPRHLRAPGSSMALLSRRVAGGRMSWVEEDRPGAAPTWRHSGDAGCRAAQQRRGSAGCGGTGSGRNIQRTGSALAP
eukprot:7120062-Pyramimonas_sp.AAC.1